MNVADVAECYEKHADALLRFAASQVGASNADDVLSVAVLGVLQQGGRGVEDLRSYLYRAVANASAKHWRTRDRRTRREKKAFLLGARGEAGEWGTSDEVVAALAGLSLQQRAVVHLTYWEDLTPSMVADRLGVSDGTVRRQLARARKRLREVLDERR